MNFMKVMCMPVLLGVALLGAGCAAPSSPAAAGAGLSEPALDALYPAPGIAVAGHSEWTASHFPQRILAFKKSPLQFGDTVFIGDSITEQGGSWAQRFNLPTVKNRGISGDTVQGVLLRQAEIGYFKPKALFLLIGINNLFNPDSTPEQVAGHIEKFVNGIHEKSPATKIYVQTILPTSTQALIPKIQDTNERLRKQSRSGSFTLIDLHQVFATDQDLIKPEYTHDGVHLTESGYKAWASHVEKYVK